MGSTHSQNLESSNYWQCLPDISTELIATNAVDVFMRDDIIPSQDIDDSFSKLMEGWRLVLKKLSECPILHSKVLFYAV